jgi:hypothetical protein
MWSPGREHSKNPGGVRRFLRNVQAFVLIFLFFISAPLHADVIYFPQVADGGGYVTTITLVNTGIVSVSGSVSYFHQNGISREVRVGSTVGSRFNVTVPAFGSTRISTSDSTPVVVSGYATFNSTSTKIRGSSNFDLRSNGVLTTMAGVIGTLASTRVLVPVDITGTESTGLAIANGRNNSTVVRLRLYNEAGEEIVSVLSPRLAPLGPQAQVADFLPSFFGSIPTPFKGAVIVEVVGDGSVAVTGLVVKEGLLSALPVIDAPLQDTGVPSAPIIAVIGGIVDPVAPTTYSFLVGFERPGPAYNTPAPQNWNEILSIYLEVSTDPTFATFPAKQSLRQGYSVAPPYTVSFLTNFTGTYYFRARVRNALGESAFTGTFTRRTP